MILMHYLRFHHPWVLWGVAVVLFVPEVEVPHPTPLSIPPQSRSECPDIAQDLSVCRMSQSYCQISVEIILSVVAIYLDSTEFFYLYTFYSDLHVKIYFYDVYIVCFY